MTTFWYRFSKLCHARGLSPQSAEIIKAAGVSSASITYWKQGSQPRAVILQRLATYFDVPIEYFTSDDPRTSSTVSDSELMFALFGDSTKVTKEDLEEVKRFAQYIKEKKEN